MSELLFIFRVSERLGALPSEYVDETMRPLPIATLPFQPPFMVGASIIRGVARPVADMRKFFGEEPLLPARRLISVRVGEDRRVGLLVDAVVGLRQSRDLGVSALPSILDASASEAIEALATLDEQVLAVLRAARIVPEEAWAMLRDSGARP